MRLKSLQRVVWTALLCLPILSFLCLFCWTQIERQSLLLPKEFREFISRRITLRHGIDTMYLFELKPINQKKVDSLVAMLRLNSEPPSSESSFIRKGEVDWWPNNLTDCSSFSTDDHKSRAYTSLWFDETNETAFIEIGRY